MGKGERHRRRQPVSGADPDIMTLDITMPEKDGLAALKEILNQGRPPAW